ncbi:MAG TPA: pyridoxal-phosphate dependent enzyme, partial [Methylophaga sp.]|nr:pyridoxal-phosphate dependent enzyme [Methylophaga sp.]
LIFRANNILEAHIVAGLLRSRDIDCFVGGHYLQGAVGDLPSTDFAGKRLDYWVSGWGTGGTLTGVGEIIKAARPETKIIATEPANASLLAGKDWASHKIQGWTPDFVPDVLNRDIYDALYPVTDEEAKHWALILAQEEGIFVGLSCGGTLAAAMKVASTAKKGSTILAMLPDTGERYLSSFLFDGMNEGSDDEWLNSL